VTATDTPVPFDPYRLGRGRVDDPARGHGAGGPAGNRVIVAYGFWVFLLSDIVMFSAFFATYAVLSANTNGGPSGRTIFDLHNVAVETACLLVSSFTCGMASVAAGARNKLAFYVMMLVTFVLGATFITLEVREFISLIQAGDGPSRSAFLSAFFALVGCHGAHVSAGLLWLLTMIAQVFAKGFRPEILRRILCFSLFWHALDIIWVAVFTVVYLLGVYP
jgi:cytochrome o ubiquinol oxidase subunit III